MNLKKGAAHPPLFSFMLIIILFLLLFLPGKSLAQESVSVSASIHERQLTLNGFTTPLSRVELTNSYTYAVTYSNNLGYFEFDRLVIPKESNDLCLQSYDSDNRPSNPVCIPPPPPVNYHTDIGPVLLPPTLTIDRENIKPGATVITSGQSIPNAIVHISFFSDKNNPLSFPKEVQAYSLPILNILTDSQGNFSLNLPTAYATDYRLFASTYYLESLSPKSNTVLFKLPSLWYLFWQENKLLIITLPLFIISLSLFVYLLLLYLKPEAAPIRYLPAIRNFLPALTPKTNIFPNRLN